MEAKVCCCSSPMTSASFGLWHFPCFIEHWFSQYYFSMLLDTFFTLVLRRLCTFLLKLKLYFRLLLSVVTLSIFSCQAFTDSWECSWLDQLCRVRATRSLV